MRRILFVIVILIAGCNQKGRFEGSELLELHKEVTSINGDVVYAYNRDRSEVISVFKLEYVKLPLYRMAINNDTIRLGEVFKGEVIIDADNARIRIDEPVVKTINTTEGRIKELVEFKPLNTGVYKFGGIIFFNDDSLNFEYQFIAVENK
jgi:hypothetical protein